MHPLRPVSALPLLLPLVIACGAAPAAPAVVHGDPTPAPGLPPSSPPPVVLPQAPGPLAPLREGEVTANLPSSDLSVPRFAAGSHLFTTCSERGTVELREGAQGLLLRAERVTNACRDAVFAPAEGRLWAVSDTGDASSFRIGDPVRERLVHLEGASLDRDTFDHQARVADDGSAVLGRSEGGFTVWALPEGKRAFTIADPCGGAVAAQGFGRDRAVILACRDGVVAPFDGKSGASLGRWKAPMPVTYFGQGGSLTALSWNPGSLFTLDGTGASQVIGVDDTTGGAVAAGGAYAVTHGAGHLSLWSVATRQEIVGIEAPPGRLAVSDDGAIVVVGERALWHPGSTGSHVLASIASDAGHLAWVAALGVERSRRCETCSDMSVTRLSNGAAATAATPGQGDRIAALSSDGSRVLVDVGTQAVSYAVRTAAGQPLGAVEAETSCVHCAEHSRLAWSRNLQFVVKATTSFLDEKPSDPAPRTKVRFEVLDLRAGLRKRALAGGIAPSFDAFTVAEDGSRIVTWGRGQAALWDGRSGKRVATFAIDDAGTTAALLEDGSALLVGSYDGRVSRIELPSGRSTPLFDGAAAADLRGDVATLLPVPGGERLIVGDGRGENDVWDLKAGKRVGTVYAFADGEWAARDASGTIAASPAGITRFHLVQGTTAGPIAPDAKVTRVDAGKMMELLGVK